MAVTTELPLGKAIDHIENGVSAALEDEIKKALMPHAVNVVEQVAKKLCKNLKANLSSYRSDMDGNTYVTLIINGEKHDIPNP